MPIRHTLALTVALSAPLALAQQSSTPPITAQPATTQPPVTQPPVTQPPAAQPPVAQPSGTQQSTILDDVVVTGTSDLLGSFLKASVSVQAGADLSAVNLRQVEQDAVATGYVKSASASLQAVNGQNVLVIAAVPNPVIGSVTVTGLTFLPAEAFKTSLANVLNIAPGATLNNVRIDQSKTALGQNFRAEGYPFLPNITTETKVAADGTVNLTYVVDETAPVTRIEVTGSTLLPQATIVAAFKPLYDAKKFTPDAYFAAVQQIQQAYQTAGYLASGVSSTTSTLQGGVLKIAVLEGQVAGVDVSGLTLPAGSAPLLVTRPGGVPGLATLEQDVRTLSNLSGQSVGFALRPSDPQNPNRVTVVFGVAEATTGPVKSIQITGNTILKTADLQAALKTKVGDVFSRQLAESDFVRLRDLYRNAGYEISTRDAVSYKDGALVFTLHEARIAGYELAYTGEKRTAERVITRELPEPGTIYNDRTFRAAIGNVTNLGLVKITGVTTKSLDPKAPENLTYVIALSETSGTRSFPLALQYDTLTGFGGSAGFENNNLFGLAHQLKVNVVGSANDAGQTLSGNLSYTIPWLDIDFADFRKNRTSVSANLSSNATGNNTLLDSTQTDTGRQYTVRSTGFGVTVGRQLIPNLGVSASVGTSYNTYFLEKLSGSEVSTTDDAAATLLLPTNILTTSLGIGSAYDSTSTPNFPTDGFRANLSASYNFGSAGAMPLAWTKLEAGVSTYFGLGNTLDKGYGVQQKQQAFAVRLNAGSYLGTPPAGTVFSIGYSNANPAYELRGYPTGAFKGTTYVTSSAEYRYDLNLNNSIAQNVFLIGFADAGSAWNGNTTPQLGYSVGLGAQVDLGFNNTPLATIRFDYGFSPATGSSQFHFRLGRVW
jgi:outer membrane protein insertion porin family